MISKFIFTLRNKCNISIKYLTLARQMRKEREGSMKYQLEGHEDGINCLAISGDESVLVSGSEDNTARVWSIEDEEKEENLEDVDDIFDDDNNNKETNDAEDKEDTTIEGAKLEDTEKTEDKEEHASAVSKEIKTEMNSESKNEGEARCLGVLRYTKL